jgi:hypothetical protein
MFFKVKINILRTGIWAWPIFFSLTCSVNADTFSFAVLADPHITSNKQRQDNLA